MAWKVGQRLSGCVPKVDEERVRRTEGKKVEEGQNERFRGREEGRTNGETSQTSFPLNLFQNT